MKKIMGYFLTAVVFLTVVSCSESSSNGGDDPDGGDNDVCTAEAVAGIVIVVLDEEGNAIVGAMVTANDGDDEEILESDEFGYYRGAYENAGTFTVTIQKDGYITETEEVIVTKDSCHVDVVEITVTLLTDESYVPSSEEEACLNAGGTWVYFSNGCADSCESQREEEEDVACTDDTPAGCECGEDMCWTGSECEEI